MTPSLRHIENAANKESVLCVEFLKIDSALVQRNKMTVSAKKAQEHFGVAIIRFFSSHHTGYPARSSIVSTFKYGSSLPLTA